MRIVPALAAASLAAISIQHVHGQQDRSGTMATATLGALDETVQLRAEVRDQNGKVMAVAGTAWSSSDASVATVDGAGLVTAAGNGTTTITATVGGASGSASVKVMQSARSVTVSPAADTTAPPTRCV